MKQLFTSRQLQMHVTAISIRTDFCADGVAAEWQLNMVIVAQCCCRSHIAIEVHEEKAHVADTAVHQQRHSDCQ